MREIEVLKWRHDGVEARLIYCVFDEQEKIADPTVEDGFLLNATANGRIQVKSIFRSQAQHIWDRCHEAGWEILFQTRVFPQREV